MNLYCFELLSFGMMCYAAVKHNNSVIESKPPLGGGVTFFKDTFFEHLLSISILPMDQTWSSLGERLFMRSFWVLTKRITWREQLTLEEKSCSLLGSNNPFYNSVFV